MGGGGLFEALRTIGDIYMGAENALVETLEREGEEGEEGEEGIGVVDLVNVVSDLGIARFAQLCASS